MATYLKVNGGMTREEVADAMGLTVQRIGQIEHEALRKLKVELEHRGLTIEDLLP